MSDLGKLVPPFPVERCAASNCRQQLDKTAFLFTNLDTGKLSVFCGECALWVELSAHDKFRLVPL